MANIRFLNRSSKRGEIWLYDQVGDGLFGGISAKEFQRQLSALGAVDQIDLRINSPGGSVFEGFAIYNQLRRHPASIHVSVDGVAASIASIIAMVGDEIDMAANAMMMIHEPMGFAMGDANEMRRTAELLDQIRGNLLDTYVARSKQAPARVSEMMSAETWMTAAEAVDLGFADLVTDEQRIAACYDLRFDWSQFKRAPQLVQLPGAGRPARDMAAVRLAAMQKRIAVIAA